MDHHTNQKNLQNSQRRRTPALKDNSIISTRKWRFRIFMRLLNKAEQIANLQNKDKIERRIHIIEMLTAYTVTLHPTKGIEPYTAMEGRETRIKLDYNKPNMTKIEKKAINEMIESNHEKIQK